MPPLKNLGIVTYAAWPSSIPVQPRAEGFTTLSEVRYIRNDPLDVSGTMGAHLPANAFVNNPTGKTHKGELINVSEYNYRIDQTKLYCPDNKLLAR